MCGWTRPSFSVERVDRIIGLVLILPLGAILFLPLRLIKSSRSSSPSFLLQPLAVLNVTPFSRLVSGSPNHERIQRNPPFRLVYSLACLDQGNGMMMMISHVRVDQRRVQEGRLATSTWRVLYLLHHRLKKKKKHRDSPQTRS